MTMKSQFVDMNDIVNFLDVFLVKFSYWSKFQIKSLLVLELYQFLFIRDWPEILKSEIPSSEFSPISGDWGKLGIPNLAQMTNVSKKVIECCKIPQENQQDRKGVLLGLTIKVATLLGLTTVSFSEWWEWNMFTMTKIVG